MAKLEAPVPYDYMYNVQYGVVREYVLIRENKKSYRTVNSYRGGNKNLRKEYKVWTYGMQRHRMPTNNFGCTLRSKEIAMILCHMVFGTYTFRASKHRGKDGATGR